MADHSFDFRRAERVAYQGYVIFSDFSWGNDVVLRFIILEHIGGVAEGAEGPPEDDEFPTPSGGFNYTRDPAEAVVFMDGSIKWDGCSNWDFPDVKNCLLHFCGKWHAESLGRLMAKCYEITERRMSQFEKELGK